MNDNEFKDEYLSSCQVCSKKFVQKYWDEEISEYIEINLDEKCFNCLPK